MIMLYSDRGTVNRRNRRSLVIQKLYIAMALIPQNLRFTSQFLASKAWPRTTRPMREERRRDMSVKGPGDQIIELVRSVSLSDRYWLRAQCDFVNL